VKIPGIKNRLPRFLIRACSFLVPLKMEQSTGFPIKGEARVSVLCDGFLEGGSCAVVLVQNLAFVDSHDPVESED
jgi:hypothetical protein